MLYSAWRAASSPLSIGNAAWQPNGGYSFEEVVEEAAVAKAFAGITVLSLLTSVPPKGTISNWLAAAFDGAQGAEETGSRACPSTRRAEEDRICSSPTTLPDIGWTEEEAFGEENYCLMSRGATQCKFTPGWLLVLGIVGPFKEFTKNRELTLFFEVKFKITDLVLTVHTNHF